MLRGFAFESPTYLTGPTGPSALPRRLAAVTGIASRAQIIQIESQVRPLLDWHLVVGVKVALSPVMSGAKLGEYCLHRWVTELGLAEQSDDIRLPGAINTSPPVTFKAQNPQSAVAGVVAALTGRATTFIMFMLSRAPVGIARTAGSEFGTARSRTRAEYPRTLRISL